MISQESRTKNYDLFKGAVALGLLIIIIILLLQGRDGTVAEKQPAADAPTMPAPTAEPTAQPTAMDWALPVLNAPQFTADGALNLSGTGEPGATVELWAGDVKLGSMPVGADGTWSWTGELDPGDYALTARTVDAAGKMLNESASLSLNVPQPEVEMALPEINVPELTDGTLSLSGTGEPGATVELWAGDVKLGSVPVGADGTWSWEGELDPGDYALTARTVDAAGKMLNESASLSLNVPQPEVEMALPEINVPELTDGTLSLSGMGEPGATVELWAGDVKLGSVPVGADGTWSWTGELDPGDYALTARTVDAAGKMLNESTALSLNVPQPEVAAAPVAPTMAEPQISAQGVVTLTGTAEPGTTVEVVADGVVVGTALVDEDGTWTLAYQAEAGTHELTARSQAQPELASASVPIDVSTPAPGTAETVSPEESGEGEGYVVQPGDSLSALAARFYDNGQLWRLIFDATNAKAAEDPTFQVIENPNFIRPGWKLWIPAQ